VFVSEFYNIIWQPHCKTVAEWEHTKGIKKQDLRKRPLAYQCIAYNRILTIQTEEGTFDLEKRKILKHNEQWSIALEKTKQYINQFIREGNRVLWKRVLLKPYEIVILYNLIATIEEYR
ncbi:hypothetical protein RhiirA1_492875, partial [Rhizophagus irregularis]